MLPSASWFCLMMCITVNSECTISGDISLPEQFLKASCHNVCGYIKSLPHIHVLLSSQPLLDTLRLIWKLGSSRLVKPSSACSVRRHIKSAFNTPLIPPLAPRYHHVCPLILQLETPVSSASPSLSPQSGRSKSSQLFMLKWFQKSVYVEESLQRFDTIDASVPYFVFLVLVNTDADAKTCSS